MCVLNKSNVGTTLAERYLKTGSRMVCLTARDEAEIRKMGITPVAARLVNNGEAKARHDSAALAELIVSLAREFTGDREFTCLQGNRR
jgi:hypothetical protein